MKSKVGCAFWKPSPGAALNERIVPSGRFRLSYEIGALLLALIFFAVGLTQPEIGAMGRTVILAIALVIGIAVCYLMDVPGAPIRVAGRTVVAAVWTILIAIFIRNLWTQGSPRLSASLSSMVQLVNLPPNDTFHHALSPISHPTTIVFCQAVVSNDGEPSTAENWSMWLTVNGQDIKADLIPLPDVTFRPNPSTPAIVYPQTEALYNVTVSQNITRDFPVRGFLFGRFDLPLQIVENSLGTFRLQFQDDRGNTYESAKKARGRFRSGGEYMPGIGKVIP